MGATLALTPLMIGALALGIQSMAPDASGSASPAPIAGLKGFESVSTLVYAADPDHPHKLRATYVFPDRVRWMISVEGKKNEHSLHYLHGESVYLVPSGASESRECAGAERAEILLQMELRRALMLYPEGPAWKGNGLERTAEVAPLGKLTARFASASDTRPCEIGDSDASGRPVDTIKAISWKKRDGRTWPAALELWHQGELVWKETIESIDTAGKFVDSYFLPTDRRSTESRKPPTGDVRDLDIPATCSLRIDVPSGTKWETVLAELLRQRAEWTSRLTELELELDRYAVVEISEEGRPIAHLLRLASVPEKPPAGFTVAPARKGRALAVKGLAEVSRSRVAELSKSLPRGATAERSYIRFEPADAEKGHVVVVLPYSHSR